MNDYSPNPIETSDVRLPEELMKLTELMAHQAHEVWAKTRISQGWRYGPVRDDAAKQHPCLIAYEDLPEEEKVYDRVMALGTLKLILKLGFTITPNA